MRKLVLLVIIILLFVNAASVADAKPTPAPKPTPTPTPTPIYTHTITPTPPVIVNNGVTDTVTSTNYDAKNKYMLFTWKYPDGNTACSSKSPNTGSITIGNKYVSSSCIVGVTGTWKISVDEYRYLGGGKYVLRGTSLFPFDVVEAPEFSKFGLAVPLFLIGIFYTRLRKSILK
ncbi:MAG: hypothetical protein ABOK23_07435 [Candidatus Methanoperedens sp.]|nr:hypothetical protein [Candidatus Methanoperedens sp.]MCZ7396192.1 hypothetical protein [Candidatus Methanoperedens sp.]